MNHRPFEDWLLENPPLTGEQKRQLNTHLKECTSCVALVEVNLALQASRQVTPLDGFTERFQARLAARKQALRRRNVWGFLLLTLSALGVLGWFAFPVLKELFLSPVNVVSSWMTAFVSFAVSLQAIFRAGMVLFKVVPGFVPAYIWGFVLLAAIGWGLVWIISFIRITKVSQGV